MAIAEVQGKAAERLNINRDCLLRELAAIRFSNITNLFHAIGAMCHLATLPVEVGRAVKRIRVSTRARPDGRTEYVKGVPMHVPTPLFTLNRRDGVPMITKHYGKHRGMVIDNVDPAQRGRLLVQVADVAGFVPSWAEPCVALSGPTGFPMGVFMVPLIGTPVWVEFEQGDVDRPIWVGCRLESAASIPSSAAADSPPGTAIVIQTAAMNLLEVNDRAPSPVSGGIVLKSAAGAMIVVNDSGIYLTNGKGASIVLAGPTVDINGGALTIT